GAPAARSGRGSAPPVAFSPHESTALARRGRLTTAQGNAGAIRPAGAVSAAALAVRTRRSWRGDSPSHPAAIRRIRRPPSSRSTIDRSTVSSIATLPPRSFRRLLSPASAVPPLYAGCRAGTSREPRNRAAVPEAMPVTVDYGDSPSRGHTQG